MKYLDLTTINETDAIGRTAKITGLWICDECNAVFAVFLDKCPVCEHEHDPITGEVMEEE